MMYDLEENAMEAVAESEELWVSLEEAAKILKLGKRYAGVALRKGFLKGRVGFRSYSGRNFYYYLPDLLVIKQQSTIPSRRT